jgi:transposase
LSFQIKNFSARYLWKKIRFLQPKGDTVQGEYITDEAWKKMLIFFKEVGGIYVGSERALKNFIESIYWIARTGAQWREMPEKYGNWNSIFTRFNAWSKKSIWIKLMTFCVQDPDLEYLSIDATIVRAHPCSAGYGDQSEQGLGRSKGGFSTKIHVKVDALGNPLKFLVTPGQSSDVTKATELIEEATGSYIIGDRGYDSDGVRAQVHAQKCIPVIPGKSNRIVAIEYDKDIYKERHVVECFFSKLKQFRRTFSRFDKSLRNFSSFLAFVGAILWLR